MSIRCGSCEQENRDGARYCNKCGAALESGGEDLLIGQLVHGRYRVVTIIGEGGMGRVYLAEQQMGTAMRKVAIKVLHGSLSKEERVRKRFYRECEVVVQLTHPNTIHFLDFGELDDGRLFIVMEYVDGPTLSDVLDEGPLEVERVDHLLEQIVRSLSEAHELGVVHRDLKPDNVMLTTRGGERDFVKVCDFGIAQRRGDGPEITIEGTVIGTPQYMSPEQLTGAGIDARSDVYSLGLILFEMLTGARPFTGSTPLQWATLHTTATPPSLDEYPASRGLSERRKDAVMAALAKRPEDRPRDVRELGARFLGREPGRSTSTAPSNAPPHAGPRPTRPATPRSMDESLPATLESGAPEVLRPAGVRSGVGMVATLLVVVGLVAGGVAAYLQRDRLFGMTTEVPDAGVEALDAGSDSGPAEPVPTDWLQIVHFERRIESPANALGPPDGEYAMIPPTGTLVLELRAGTRIASDGTSGPDVALVIDEERSGPYRADFGVAPNEYTTVASDLVGSLELDCDQYDITRVRFIRLKNRGRRNVYIDAVGSYATVRVD